MKRMMFFVVLIAALAFAASCGSGEHKLKVTWDDETEEDSSPAADSDGSEEAGGGDSTADDGVETSGGGEGEEYVSDDTDGGIQYLEMDGGQAKDRHFIGTFQFEEYGYYGSAYPDVCEYGFPMVVRLYSHDDVIDFENSTGDLVWIARLFEDETFDFQVGFLNKFGQPSIRLVCTCYIDEGYWDYYTDEIMCGCDPAGDDENCSLFYEKLET